MQIEKDINKLADLFESNLLDTNRGYNYYIDWSNIDGYKKYEIEIHAMDVLIKKEDDTFFDVFKELIIKLPTIIEIFPYLFALAKFSVDCGKSRLEPYNKSFFLYKFFQLFLR